MEPSIALCHVSARQEPLKQSRCRSRSRWLSEPLNGHISYSPPLPWLLAAVMEHLHGHGLGGSEGFRVASFRASHGVCNASSYASSSRQSSGLVWLVSSFNLLSLTCLDALFALLLLLTLCRPALAGYGKHCARLLLASVIDIFS